MLQQLRLKKMFLQRKWQKFKSDPEKFFLDSHNPLMSTIGDLFVTLRESRAKYLENNNLDPSRNLSLLAPLHACPLVEKKGISVIVPVYNAPEHLERCMQSVLSYTNFPYSLILIDDCSTDPRIGEILYSLPENGMFKVVRNQSNLGYTGTVNKGISLAGDNDVVLLNSDVQVGPCWLQNLHIAAYLQEDIATVTPLSDNAGAFSAPETPGPNQLPPDQNAESIMRAVSQSAPQTFPRAPTGNGFCMYMRRDAIDQVGLFDRDTYPRGYCEENDWCQRAIQLGWTHLVDGRTYVLHSRSASFGSEREKLLARNREILDRRYPEYRKQVTHFLNSPDMQEIRNNVRETFQRFGHNHIQVRPRILFVISSQTGGTPQTNADLMQGLRDSYSPFLLVCDARRIQLKDCSGNSPQMLEQVQLTQAVRALEHTSPEYDRWIGHFMLKYAIELLHIRHLCWHSLNLPRIAKNLGIPVVLSLHDYYTICPNTQLLDESGVHCAGRCTSTSGDCETPLWGEQERPELKNSWVFTWREKMREVFSCCDVFVTTCGAAKDIFTAIYPELETRPFYIIPHGRDFEKFIQPDWLFESSERIRILFPGNLSRAKGMDLILGLKEVDTSNLLEIHLLGKVPTYHLKKMDSGFVVHGTYKRDEFQDKILQIRPHLIGLFSLWPETYSHTLTEAWASGLPVVVTPFGALRERVQYWGGGWVLTSTNVKYIYLSLLSYCHSESLENKNRQIQFWQKACKENYNVFSMASRYKDIYREFLPNNA